VTNFVLAIDQIQSKLKERFYFILVNKSYLTLDAFLSDFLTDLKYILKSGYISLYRYNPYTEQFYRFSDGIKEDFSKQSISLSEFNGIIESNRDGLIFGDALNVSPNMKHSSFIIPIKEETEYTEFLWLTFDTDQDIRFLSLLLQKTESELNTFFRAMKKKIYFAQRENQYEQLFQLNQKIRITMSKEEVLEETVQILYSIYPKFEYHLIFIENEIQSNHLPIKGLGYDEVCQASTNAYINGELQFGEFTDKEISLYLPLKGKQGVYGILEVIIPHHTFITKEDMHFLTKIVNTAGFALENVSLYEQSNRLINNLQLINKSSQEFNNNMKLSDTHAYLFSLIENSFQANEIGFILFDNDYSHFKVLEESSSYFKHEEGKKFVRFLSKKLLEESDYSLFIGDFSDKYDNHHLPFHSVMAVPMLHEERVLGFVIVLKREEYAFSLDTFKLLKSLVQHSTLTVVNALLKEELEYLVRTDYLTKLYSRKYLDEMLQKHLDNGTKGSFILIDIDNFKAINDRFGHEVGDKIILQVADIIRENIRSNDIAARWGGEELAIFLPNTSITASIQIAERLVERVAQNTNPKVTISCGISYWDENMPDQTTNIFFRADKALYRAKAKGKNQVVKQDEVFLS
jgi:diguanylate cyclase (GGDEF)-like protein